MQVYEEKDSKADEDIVLQNGKIFSSESEATGIDAFSKFTLARCDDVNRRLIPTSILALKEKQERFEWGHRGRNQADSASISSDLPPLCSARLQLGLAAEGGVKDAGGLGTSGTSAGVADLSDTSRGWCNFISIYFVGAENFILFDAQIFSCQDMRRSDAQ